MHAIISEFTVFAFDKFDIKKYLNGGQLFDEVLIKWWNILTSIFHVYVAGIVPACLIKFSSNLSQHWLSLRDMIDNQERL